MIRAAKASHRWCATGIVVVLAVTGCSSGVSRGVTQVCDPTTDQCDEPAKSDTGRCGANAELIGDRCECKLGFADCNSDRNAGGDCECGGRCGSDGECDTSCDERLPGSCRAITKFCDAGTCEQCPAGKYNCSGLGCTSDEVCADACNDADATACGFAGYCVDGRCATCETDRYNCDLSREANDCESTAPCTPCEASCFEQFDFQCAEDPSGICRECTADEHCTGNPRSKGRTCLTEQMICICEAPEDCAGRSVGNQCIDQPRKCGCTEDDHCTIAPYTLCSAGTCVKPCLTAQDCSGGMVCDPDQVCRGVGP